MKAAQSRATCSVPILRGSQGNNSSVSFKSVAVVNHCASTRLDQPSEDQARDILKEHVLWMNPVDDIFVSFSSSFLWVLQHSGRKIAVDFKTSTSSMQTCIADTSRLAQGSFTHTVALLEKFSLSETDDGRLRHDCHEVGSLAEDTIYVHDACRTVSSEALVQSGLLELIPELSDRRCERLLHIRIERLRFE